MSTFCGYFNQGQCASCTWIERPYAEQVAAKEAAIREALAFLAPAPGGVPLAPAVLSPPTGFRNRAKMSVTGTVDAPVIGLLGRGGSLDDGRELLACPIHHPRLNEIIAELPAFLRRARVEPYRIGERAGELKGLILFHSPLTDQTYLRFVLRSQECVSRLRKHLPALRARFPSLGCVSANLQPIPHAILEGPEEIFLTERASIDHQLGPVRLQLAPQAFTQTNLGVATELYATAARWIQAARPARMLELFCGQGAFSFFAAAGAGEVRGIDINAAGVDAANATAREHGFAHLSFRAVDAGQVGAEIAAYRPDLILVNPPRRGLGEAVKLFQAHPPVTLIYSSCALETLAGDLRALADRYALEQAQLFDIFPHTAHFETLVRLRRK